MAGGKNESGARCGGRQSVCSAGSSSLFSPYRTGNATGQTSPCSVYWLGNRPARSCVWPARSIRQRTVQRDSEGYEGHNSSFLPLCGLVTLLQSAARAVAKREEKI